MTAILPQVSRLLMQICAARLDTAVSGGQFIAMLEELLDVAVSDDSPATEAIDASEHNTADVQRTAASTNGSADRAENPGSRSSRIRTSYDDRVRIRMRADEARGEGTYLPRGFVAGIASEYHLSEQTVYNILKGEQ